MSELFRRGDTVGVAETTSGGLLSAALWSSPIGSRVFKGAGVRLAYGINRAADEETAPGPHMVHSHTVHLPLGALLELHCMVWECSSA